MFFSCHQDSFKDRLHPSDDYNQIKTICSYYPSTSSLFTHTDTPTNNLNPTLNLPPPSSSCSTWLCSFTVISVLSLASGSNCFCSCSSRNTFFLLPPAEQSDLSPWKLIMKCLGATFGTNCHPPNKHARYLDSHSFAEITVFVALFVIILSRSSTSRQ